MGGGGGKIGDFRGQCATCFQFCLNLVTGLI